MRYITPTEYARLRGVSLPAVYGKIKRRTLKTAIVPVNVRKIELTDEEYERLKQENKHGKETEL